MGDGIGVRRDPGRASIASVRAVLFAATPGDPRARRARPRGLRRGSKNDGGATDTRPVLGQKGGETEAAPGLGFPILATKNTTRVAGGDPIADAAGVAQAVFPSTSADTRPSAVALADRADWRVTVSAAQ